MAQLPAILPVIIKPQEEGGKSDRVGSPGLAWPACMPHRWGLSAAYLVPLRLLPEWSGDGNGNLHHEVLLRIPGAHACTEPSPMLQESPGVLGLTPDICLCCSLYLLSSLQLPPFSCYLLLTLHDSA